MKFDIGYLWSRRYAQWIILSLLIIFSFLIIYELVDLFLFLSKIKQAAPTAAIKAPIVKKQEKIVDNLNAELFGVYTPPALKPENIQPSKLKVELIGIMYSENPQNSFIIIKNASGEEEVFKIGDLIADNAVINQIFPDGIVVRHNDKLEKLNFSTDTLTFEPVSGSLSED